MRDGFFVFEIAAGVVEVDEDEKTPKTHLFFFFLNLMKKKTSERRRLPLDPPHHLPPQLRSLLHLHGWPPRDAGEPWGARRGGAAEERWWWRWRRWWRQEDGVRGGEEREREREKRERNIAFLFIDSFPPILFKRNSSCITSNPAGSIPESSGREGGRAREREKRGRQKREAERRSKKQKKNKREESLFFFFTRLGEYFSTFFPSPLLASPLFFSPTQRTASSIARLPAMTTDCAQPSTTAAAQSCLAVLPERLPFFSESSTASGGSASASSPSPSPAAVAAREQRRRLHLYNADAESHLAFKVRAIE